MKKTNDSSSSPRPFSYTLEQWAQSKEPKTVEGLTNVISEKSFALIFLVLMAIPALPIPTGGITHLFELVVALLALELIAGRETIWLPKKWRKLPLGKTLTTKGMPKLISVIRWLERFSRPRLSGVTRHREFHRLLGVLILICTTGAFVSPPFSGLDTLPALGAVFISLSVILEDIASFVLGVAIAAVGIGIEISLAHVITSFVTHLL